MSHSSCGLCLWCVPLAAENIHRLTVLQSSDTISAKLRRLRAVQDAQNAAKAALDAKIRLEEERLQAEKSQVEQPAAVEQTCAEQPSKARETGDESHREHSAQSGGPPVTPEPLDSFRLLPRPTRMTFLPTSLMVPAASLHNSVSTEASGIKRKATEPPLTEVEIRWRAKNIANDTGCDTCLFQQRTCEWVLDARPSESCLPCATNKTICKLSLPPGTSAGAAEGTKRRRTRPGTSGKQVTSSTQPPGSIQAILQRTHEAQLRTLETQTEYIKHHARSTAATEEIAFALSGIFRLMEEKQKRGHRAFDTEVQAMAESAADAVSLEHEPPEAGTSARALQSALADATGMDVDEV